MVLSGVSVASRGLNTAVGLFVIGFGVCLIAFRCDTVETFAWSEASVWALGVETMLWIPIVALLTILVTEQQDAAAAFTRRAQALQRYAKRRPLSPLGCR